MWSSGGTGGFSGSFVGSPADGGITGMASNSFCLFANPNSSGAYANAERGLSNSLAIGQILSFQWGINWDSAGGNKGFNLYAGGQEIFNINNGSSQDITCNGSNVGFGYGTAVMTWSFERTGTNSVKITANDRDGTGTFTTNVVVANAAIDTVKFYATAMGGGDQRQPYFNNLTVTEPAAASMAVPGDHAFLGAWSPGGSNGTGMTPSTNPATPFLWTSYFKSSDARQISFKFAANGTFDFSWGADPARPGYAKRGGDPIKVTLPATGLYKFTFDQSTLQYSMVRASSADFGDYQMFADTYGVGIESDDDDGDGLTNLQEYGLNTDPSNRDSDGDTLLDGWESGAVRYQIVTGSYTWNQAKADAESKGAHLATITSASEASLLLATFGAGASGAANAGLTDLWLGASDATTEGSWRWVTDETWSYTNWAPTQPDGGTGQNYLRYKEGWDDWFATPTSGSLPVTIRGYLLEKGYPSDPLKADTDGDGLPDWWEGRQGLDPNVATGADGALGDPDADFFTNKQEFEGQSNPLSASSVPANRAVTFSLDLNRQITAGTFVTNNSAVEVWGTFNDWGNFTNKFSLTNNGSGIYSATYAVPGAAGATNLFKFVSFSSNNTLSWEPGNDRLLVMGATGVGTNLPVAYWGEVRPVTFSVNMGVQRQLGNFTPGTDRVYLVGSGVPGGWDPGTELTRLGSTDVYSGQIWMAGREGDSSSFKFKAGNTLSYELGANTRSLNLGVRDLAQTNPEVFFNNTTLRTLTFAVNMNVQTNAAKLAFNPAADSVEIRADFNGFGGGTNWRLTNNGAGIFTGSFSVAGLEGQTNGYKYVAIVGTNVNFERVDMPRTNSLLNRTLVLGPANTNQTVHSAGSPALFSEDDGAGPTEIGLSANSIAENNAVNALIGNLSVVDPTVGDSHVFSLAPGTGDTDNGSFSISGTALRTSVVFDYETKASYSIRLRSTDAYGNSFEKIFAITVTDVPEIPADVSLVPDTPNRFDSGLVGNLRPAFPNFTNWLGTNYAPTPELLAQYVYGAISPTNPVNPSNLPTGEVSGGNLVLTYSVRKSATNLNLVVPQWHTNLALADYWSEVDSNSITPVATNVVDGVEVIRKRASVPVDTNRKFLRLKISE